MGNSINKDSFYMHIKIIGSNMEKFYNEFNKSIYLRNIIKFWTIDKLKKSDIRNQLNEYFDYLEGIIDNEENKDINLREVLILKVNNVFEPVINILLERMNKLSETHNMPLILLLTIENSRQN